MRSCGCPLGRGNDVGHKVSVDPVDDAGVHVCHLKQRGGLGVSGATIYLDHISHPPVAAVINDYRHACPDMQKDRIRLGYCNTARMVNRHTIYVSISVLFLGVRRGQGGEC